MQLGSTFLDHYRADHRPAARLEYVLAVGRTFLTVTALAAIYTDPTEPSRLAGVTYAVLSAYALYSVAVLIVVRGAARVDPGHGRVLHGLDVLWTAALTFVSEGPVSPFFLFFLFVLLAAAYRWGFTGTVTTAAVTVVVFILETAAATAGPWRRTWFADIDFELNRTILRVGYLLMTGFLLGYLAEHEKQFRAETAAIADAMRQPRVDLGLGGSIVALGRMLVQAFRARGADVVVQEHTSGNAQRWTIDADGTGRPEGTDLDALQQQAWLFPDPGITWHASIGPGMVPARTTDPNAWALRRTTVTLPADFSPSRAFSTVTVANAGLPDEWRARVFLYDVDASDTPERRLHFLESLMHHITPGLSNVVLLRRLRSQAGAAERARVARELHDGTIQALIGLELTMEALRRRIEGAHPAVAAELSGIQEHLRAEVLGLRELMQALRPVEIDGAHQLPDVLAQVVERFRRDSGVSARFVSNARIVSLRPEVTLEVVRIVQEALANVRRHSRASNVIVRFTSEGSGYTLVVEDDGRGFEFEGRLTGDELDRQRTGPAIIKERTRLVGGTLTVESTPGEGARVEVRLAAEAHA